MAALARSAYVLPVTLEVVCQEEEEESFLERAHEAALMLDGLCRAEF